MVGFSCSVLSCRDVFCPESIIRVSPVSSLSPPRIPFEQRADYWFCGCLAGLQAESGGGHPLDMTQRSKRAPSSTLTSWPWLSSCLQVLCESWEMVTAELIGRHFIIGSWWLTVGLSFSNSLISLFVKVQNVWSVSQVCSCHQNQTVVYSTSHHRTSDLAETRVKGRFMQDPMCSRLTHWWGGISQHFWL